MPLSGPFKKSPKKGPAETPQEPSARPSMTDDSLFSPEMQKKRYDAATEFMQIFQEKIPLVNGKPHAGTVLAVAARLAGTSLFRAINKEDFTPGVIVLSEEVNEAWPQLMNLFALYCRQNGIDVMARPLVKQFPEQDKPRMGVEQVQAEYQDQFAETMQKHGLDYLNGARAGMVICSMIFQYHCTVTKDIDPYVATGVVAMGVVEGAKTAPPPFGSGGKMQNKTESRLVLGEREAAIREARDHGGAYIDPPPDVVSVLKQGNMNPYIIYEQALIQQLEQKTQRIDFVQADVDKLFDEWKSKPEGQAPIPVRLMIWLKNNASAYGYEQRGNSWILKG